MAVGTRGWKVGAIAGALGALLVVVGTCAPGGPRRAHGDEPPPTDTSTRRAPPPPAGAPATTEAPPAGAPDTPELARSPVGDALAPAHAAPALGLALEGTRVDVDPFSGMATLLETDAHLPLGLGIRRARTVSDAPGLFGRGWRSEVDARLRNPCSHPTIMSTPTAGCSRRSQSWMVP